MTPWQQTIRFGADPDIGTLTKFLLRDRASYKVFAPNSINNDYTMLGDEACLGGSVG